MDAGFVLALPFHHGDLEPDCVEVSTRGGGGGLMRGIKIPLHDFALKMQGGLMREGGRICGTLRYIGTWISAGTCHLCATYPLSSLILILVFELYP